MNSNHIDSTSLDFSNAGTSLSNVFNKIFPYGYEARNKEIALMQASIPNVFPNITSALNNQYFFYNWYDTAGANFRSWLVDLSGGDGSASNMDVSDIQGAMYTTMKSNGHYLTDANGNDVFYISLSASTIKNKFIFSFTVVPTVLPAGWSNHTLIGNGSNPMSLALTNEFMQIQIADGSSISGYKTDGVGTVTNASYTAGAGLQTNLGFTTTVLFPNSSGTAPSILAAQNTLSPINIQSNTTPYIDNVQILTLNCNFIKANRFDSLNSLSTVLFGNTALGSSIDWDPQYKLWLPINDGNYTNLSITICDQTGTPLNDMQDHSSVFTIAIRDNASQNEVEQIRGPPGGPLIQFTDQAQMAQGFKRLRT